ncbi:Late embryogenesis abundant protein 2 [Chloroherpeton thalassium ATCC 35110]|uniref:Late embryogenesis abundant protein 2 n=1 Tax=Chloroherpeton thalassium (strain ATCC 35110 / GB-78) TaxID=517418 RepID=B3QS72_CHLT3|nr:LEA type 2 family protein [Chloroherpeton thalassium]ACF14017.1 Late embryogenesis abundant protein 2 [Chloroherpeton thalassium ATCC 35110]
MKPGKYFRLTLSIFLFLFFVMPLANGCKTVQKIAQQTATAKKPTISIANVEISSVSFVGIDFVFDIKIQNPNSFGVTLSSFDYNFLINQHSFVNGKQEDPLTVAANATSNVQLPLTIQYLDLYAVFSSLKNSRTAAYQLTAGFYFDLPVLGTVRIPAEKSGSFSLK